MEVLQRIPTQDIAPVTFFIGMFAIGGIVACVAILSYWWSMTRMAEHEAALKLEMIRQGYSAEDVERVLKARTAPNFGRKKMCKLRLQEEKTGVR